MSEKRKDRRGRILRNNENQMPDGRYRYRYTDADGTRRAVYSWRLTSSDPLPPGKRPCACLRQKEEDIELQLQSEINVALAENTTLNDMFEKYLELHRNVKASSLITYRYNYDHFVRDVLGTRKVRTIRYSDIKKLYTDLLDSGKSVNTVRAIQTFLHPTFTLAIRDSIIRTNPADHVVGELAKAAPKPAKRHALTVDETALLLDFLRQSDTYRYLLPLVTFFLGTGCRVGEVIGLRWEDIDLPRKLISINHNMTYRSDGMGGMMLSVGTPKTAAGSREIPLFQEVADALLEVREQQMLSGLRCTSSVDGYTNFIFLNQNGSVYFPTNLNKVLKAVRVRANEFEAARAELESREPVVIRPFSLHSFRHTFCTRLCEVETNIKLIMTIMGHDDVQTTINIYNEIQDSKKSESYAALQGKIKIS